jgi:4-hydroxy-2-oxoheptanedioate aldolase
MRLLDAGAYGIIGPMINNRAQAEAFVGACRYPPLGYRSYGPIRARVYAGDDYFANASETVLTLAMIETAEALENLEDILSVEGLDGVYVGTVDLSISMGLPDLGQLENAQLRRAIDTILAATDKYGLVAGIHASSPAESALLNELGFRLITPVNDSNVLRLAVAEILNGTRSVMK